MGKIVLLIMTIGILAGGCAPKSADLTAPGMPGGAAHTALLAKYVRYDRHGLPRFGPVLPERPSDPGEQYTVVYYANHRPVKSYEISVAGERRPDIIKPFEVLFQWTGAGFMVGASMLWGAGPVQFTYDARTDMLYTTATLAPIVVMSAGGFIVGIVAGMVSAGEELRYAMFRPYDVVMSATLYEYDQNNRLRRLRMFLPDERTEVVRTEYFYEDSEVVPVKMESRSYPENKVRVIGK
jgi:hypothetical protein